VTSRRLRRIRQQDRSAALLRLSREMNPERRVVPAFYPPPIVDLLWPDAARWSPDLLESS
jgi:hypothetical protein